MTLRPSSRASWANFDSSRRSSLDLFVFTEPHS
jgi:hypothetical protein